MHLIYLGSVSGKEELTSLSGGSVAGNKMQWNILMELSKYDDITIDAFSLLSVASFPKDKHLFIPLRRKNIGQDVYVTQEPFINLPIIKQWSQKWSLYFYAKKVVTNKSIALSYNLYVQEGGALVKLKKKSGIRIAALLADLPIDDNYRRKGIGKILYNIFFEISRKNIAMCNNLVVLNEQAIKEFAPNANYTVVEGGVALDEIDSCTDVYKIKSRNIVYSGALTDYSGITELIKALGKVPKDITLELYGDGPLREYIIDVARENHQVVYKGKVSNDQMREIQCRAWLLVNPRPIEDPIARVTFPSKIFEYMLSGRPILSTKQYGFTEEYAKYMFLVENNDEDTFAKKICEISKMSDLELNEMGTKCKKFVIQSKNWAIQTKRIHDFLYELK